MDWATSRNRLLPTITPSVSAVESGPLHSNQMLTYAQTAAAKIYARESAAHLYLLDYTTAALPALAEYLRSTYPATKITHLQGDAADAATIKDLVARVVKEEGRLDFIFANAGIVGAKQGQGSIPRGVDETDGDEFVEVMRVNALGYVFLLDPLRKMRQVVDHRVREGMDGIWLEGLMV